MAAKPIIISSLGLKNVVMNRYQETDDFIFIFGECEFRMKSIFAEFISPIVSHLHQTDLTINSINFGEHIPSKNKEFNELSKSIITSDTISLLQQIACGSCVEINEEQAIKLRFLSILLGNEELHSKLNEVFPPNYSEENVNSYLKSIDCCYLFSCFKPDFDFTSILSFVASHFYLLDKDDFLNQPRRIQYQIISHPKLRIENEDSLFDIIAEIVEKKNETEEINDILFFEQIEFSSLSDGRLRTFVDLFNINEMSGPLWCKLRECLFGQTNKQSKRAVDRIKPFIIVGGFDEFYQLGEKPNDKDDNNHPIISPPLKSSVDPSTLLSYSAYESHSVLVTSSGSLLGIGCNVDGRISSSFADTETSQFTEFSIEDDSGHRLVPISAYCTAWGTLYLFSKRNGIGNQLVYCDLKINYGNPIFLDIGNQNPVALFGGCDHAAAINDKGEVIFINRHSVKKSPESTIEAVSLPDGEKASSVACCENKVAVLSANGRVFSSDVEEESSILKFSAVKELENEEIICLSGTNNHFLAVSKDGRVFGCGTNVHGQLSCSAKTSSVSSFTEIQSLRGYKIRAAYAGGGHSLFETDEGKILSSGSNGFGELLLSSGTRFDKIYSPKETTITNGATFCIPGTVSSIVFIGSEPPPNTPNRRIK